MEKECMLCDFIVKTAERLQQILDEVISMRKRVRYFKMIEIDRNTFIEAVGQNLGFYSQLIQKNEDGAYIAVNVRYMEEISVPLDIFDSEVNDTGEECIEDWDWDGLPIFCTTPDNQ